ncbi:hypothetical protein LG634_22475 [Streptomyces bambusae]|uniref:hypothetical protein n=1 Tax=Streptomyces bambusae TaxID=1550616 RepID=UPI001CFCCAEC|nr:hypothetical protein [Streptomyces bambusae]MCB5167582.1 hypothetical protein [Streptomyces bambusae]
MSTVLARDYDTDAILTLDLRVAASLVRAPSTARVAATPRPALVKVSPWRPLATRRSPQG